MSNNRQGHTVECTACSWQGDINRTGSGHCRSAMESVCRWTRSTVPTIRDILATQSTRGRCAYRPMANHLREALASH